MYVRIPKLSDAESTAGGIAVAEDSPLGNGAGRAIFVGVTTGVLIWLTTRILDKMFGISKGGV